VRCDHELGQRTPQREDRAAAAPVRVNARPAELDHARAQRAQRAQPGQVEFVVAVQAADTARVGRRQHTIGADHRAGLAATAGCAHEQVFAERIEQVDVVTGRRAGRYAEARAHLFGEDEMPQALRLRNLVLVACPHHIETRRFNSAAGRGRIAAMKRPP
jgi:hypothetical protein